MNVSMRIPFRNAALLGLTLAVAGVGCGPADNDVDRWDDDELAEAPSPQTTVQVAVMRGDVDVILDSLRAEVDGLRAGAQDEPLERWTDVAAKVEETRGDVLQDVDEVDVADADEARRVRDRAAERIAELEAEVARAELEFAADRQALRDRTDERLSELEENLTELARLVPASDRPQDVAPGAVPPEAQAPETDPADPAAAPEQTRVMTAAHDLDLDPSEVRGLQEDLVEAQQLAAERVADEDRDLDDLRDELSDRVAELTRDIRKHWHAFQWSTTTQ